MAKRKMPVKVDEVKTVVNDVKKEKVQVVNAIVAHCQQVNVRSEPNRTATVLFKTVVGAKLVVEALEGNWVHILKVDGKPCNGYIMREFVKEV